MIALEVHLSISHPPAFNLPFLEEEQLLIVSYDRTLKLQSENQSHENFLISLKNKYLELCTNAINISFQLPMSEFGFSIMTNIKYDGIYYLNFI